MARALAAALAAALLVAVPGAGGAPGAETPRPGGTLELVIALEPPCLNVLVSPCVASVEYWKARSGPVPISGAIPKLVSDVDFTREPPFTLTYHIRPEARWSDGVPVTARDFVFTYRARLAHPPGDDNPYERISSVRALGPKTVRVVLDSRLAFWRDLFDVVLPSHALAGRDLAKIWVDRIDDPRTGRPIASGPFLVQQWKRGERLTLVRNPRYWGRRALLDRIDLRFTLDPSVVAQLFRQGADVGLYQFSEDLVTALSPVPGVRLSLAPDAPGWEHLDIRIGRRRSPGAQGQARPAGARARHRPRRHRAGGFRRGRTGVAAAGQRRPPQQQRRVPAELGHLPLSAAEAVRQLQRAGCRRGGDGIFSCAGEPLSSSS